MGEEELRPLCSATGVPYRDTGVAGFEGRRPWGLKYCLDGDAGLNPPLQGGGGVE